MRPFPSGDARWQISSEGGGQPRWGRDGREIFYVTPGGTVMAVEVKPSGSELNPQPPSPLFTEPSLRVNNEVFFYGGAAAYDVAPTDVSSSTGSHESRT